MTIEKKRGHLVSLFYFYTMRRIILLNILPLIFANSMSAQSTQFIEPYFGWSFQVPAGLEMNSEPFDEFDLPEGTEDAPFQELNISRLENADEDGFPDNLSGVSCWSLPLVDENPKSLMEEEIAETLDYIKELEANVEISRSQVTISGHLFERIDSIDKDDEFGFLNNTYFMAPMKDYVLRIEISYDNNDDRDLLMNMILNSKFEGKGQEAGK